MASRDACMLRATQLAANVSVARFMLSEALVRLDLRHLNDVIDEAELNFPGSTDAAAAADPAAAVRERFGRPSRLD